MKELIDPIKNVYLFFLLHIVMGFLIALISVNDLLDDWRYVLIGTLWGTMIVSTQWIGHAFIQIQLEKKYPWLEQTRTRVILTLVTIVGYSIFAFIGVQVVMGLMVFGRIPQFVLDFNFSVWGLPVIIAFAVSVFVAAIGFFKSWKVALQEQEELKTEMLTYKYESLRNQINPHFMFNSLNVISDLVYDDQKLAVKFIQQFSDIYRYVLDCREKELISLKEELKFIDKFMFLLKIRFEDKLEVKIDVETKDGELIVPLALQLLVENVVKHNEVSTANPLKISIRRDGNYIMVSNPIQLKKNVEGSSKIGLKNLELQYGFFSDRLLSVVEEDGYFIVEIPILMED